MSDPTQRERATRALRSQIAKGVESIKEEAKTTGLLEVVYLLHVLRLTRLFRAHPEESRLAPELTTVGMALSEDTSKYAVQMCMKYGHGGSTVVKGDGTPALQLGAVQRILRIGNEINHKYDLQSLISLLDVSVSGERDHILQVDLTRLDTDPDTGRLYKYFARIDANSLGPGPRTLETMLPEFKQDFNQYADLFQTEFGVSVDAYIGLLEFLLRVIRERLEEALGRIPRVAPGRIDIATHAYFLEFFRAIAIRRSEIVSICGAPIEALLARLTFKTERFDESELRFNAIARAPLLAATPEWFLVSPELLLDSVRVNTHYSFLEAGKVVSERYKERASDEFLSRVARVASPLGFVEVGRNVSVYDGKSDLGDLDLVLRNSDGEYIVVEGKNHALPLDVYFRDAVATRHRLAQLRDEWEAKVLRRNAYLAANPGACEVGQPWLCVIVSREPEVLSHFSSVLVLSIREFEYWLPNRKSLATFGDLYQARYEGQMQFTKDELDILIADGFLPRFEPVRADPEGNPT